MVISRLPAMILSATLLLCSWIQATAADLLLPGPESPRYQLGNLRTENDRFGKRVIAFDYKRTKSGKKIEMESFSDYPDAVSNNAQRGIDLNKKVNRGSNPGSFSPYAIIRSYVNGLRGPVFEPRKRLNIHPSEK